MPLFFRALFLSLFIPLTLSAQQDSLSAWENQLARWGQKVIGGQQADSIQHADSMFVHYLEKFIRGGHAYDYPFVNTPTLAKIAPPDGRFRLLNWMVPRTDGSSYHHCYFINQPEAEGPAWLAFDDVSDGGQPIQNIYLKKGEFVGALYYQIIVTGKKKDPTYTLLGYDRNSGMTQRKIVEPFSFDNKGYPRFGGKIFKLGKEWQDRPVQGKIYRVSLEYSQRFTASVRWLPSQDMIVLDHTSPLNPQAKGVYADYSPDFSYDGLIWEKDHWEFKSQVQFKNNQSIEIRPPDKPVGPPPSRRDR